MTRAQAIAELQRRARWTKDEKLAEILAALAPDAA